MEPPPSRDAAFRLFEKCQREKCLHTTRHVHALMCNHGLDVLICVKYHLIRLFDLCGSLAHATQVFVKGSCYSACVWNAIIVAHANHGDNIRALDLYDAMHQKGVKADKFSFLSALKACSNFEAVGAGRSVHHHVLKDGLGSDINVMNTIIDMYAKCASLDEASRVFENLHCRDAVSWSVLIAGYAAGGDAFHCLKLFNAMQEQAIEPPEYLFPNILKACGVIGAIKQGQWIHDRIVRDRHESNLVIQSALVDMYAKCGIMQVSHKLFDELDNHDVISWASIIAGYNGTGDYDIAMEMYNEMLNEDIIPDKFIFSCVLRSCGGTRDINQGKKLHDQIVKSGLDMDIVLGSNLVDMYVNCENFNDSLEVFNRMMEHNALSWSAAVRGCVDHGHYLFSLELFESMLEEGIEVEKSLLISLSKACSHLVELKWGRLIHEKVICQGWEDDLLVGNAIMNLYANCGNILEARIIFDRLLEKDMDSWNIILTAYGVLAEFDPTLELLEALQQTWVAPNKILLLSMLKACGNIAAIVQGRFSHTWGARLGFHEDINIGTALIDMYNKCGRLAEAQNTFDRMCHPDVVACGAMLAAYCDHGCEIQAFEHFENTQRFGVTPDKQMCLGILKVCSTIRSTWQGHLVHDQLIRMDFDFDLVVGNALVDMYSKCDCPCEALRMFTSLPHQNLISWGALMAGYVENGNAMLALELFRQMQEEQLQLDEAIYSCVLSACASLQALHEGIVIHNQLVLCGIELDAIIACALLGLYANCGMFEEAHTVLQNIPSKEQASWATLFAAYATYGHGKLVIDLCEKMECEAVVPGTAVLIGILKAYAEIGAIEQGKLLYAWMIESGAELDVAVGNALVDMYAKCGSLDEALEVFNHLQSPDIVSWGVMITACVSNGYYLLASKLFEDMQHQGFMPNDVIGTAMLGACSHTGSTKEGVLYFDSMKTTIPNAEHYRRIVDMFCRTGGLNVAKDLLQTIPMRDDIIMWTSLLNSCRTYSYSNMGDTSLKHFLVSHKQCDSIFTLIEKIYANVLKVQKLTGTHERTKQMDPSALKDFGPNNVEGTLCDQPKEVESQGSSSFQCLLQKPSVSAAAFANFRSAKEDNFLFLNDSCSVQSCLYTCMNKDMYIPDTMKYMMVMIKAE